ncbi:ROK family protein [Lachnoclostridium sp. Marseille-P6806]|uniref:ROK family protein n=1 Tax=Lachnoclostridium sp. Marseille-P6806 TaxID=2364793 RepID=UPI001A9138D8|nr:ROK family protein [Lachnoclostridium sp. Marseille-P6806]
MSTQGGLRLRQKGHLEQYASATGIRRLAHKYLSEHPDVRTRLRTIPEPTAKDIFDAVKAGDEASLELVEILGNMLGRAFAMISCVIDPEVYVIGVGVSKAGSILTDTTRKHYIRYAFHASERTEIRLAELGNDAGIIGAVRHVL